MRLLTRSSKFMLAKKGCALISSLPFEPNRSSGLNFSSPVRNDLASADIFLGIDTELFSNFFYTISTWFLE